MQIIVLVVVLALAAGLLLLTNNSDETSSENKELVQEEEMVKTKEQGEDAISESEEGFGNDLDQQSFDDNSSPKDEESAGGSVPATDDGAASQVDTGITVTFTKVCNYQTPARTTHEVEVTLTIENNIVVASDVVYDGNQTGYTNENQSRFDKAYQAEVVGKNIDNISLSRVGGASLTSSAFNEAVSKIKADA